jgi:hypothetical protein
MKAARNPQTLLSLLCGLFGDDENAIFSEY